MASTTAIVLFSFCTFVASMVALATTLTGDQIRLCNENREVEARESFSKLQRIINTVGIISLMAFLLSLLTLFVSIVIGV